MNWDTLSLTKALIEKPSVTPKDEGCLELITSILDQAGFKCERIDSHGVSNLWATFGSQSPTLCLIGHTDVVPHGDSGEWKTPPFKPTIKDEMLYGRGACDMKGSLSALVMAAHHFAKANHKPKGRLALLITSDEEGAAQYGTKAVMETLHERGENIQYALVGEPSSSEILGDTIKIGRRGSLTGHIILHGVQGHVAYPDLAVNPIHQAMHALSELMNHSWGSSHPNFPPTSLQFSNIQSGTGADNVIPGTLQAVFNFRYNPNVTPANIKDQFEHILDKHGLKYEIAWRLSGEPFFTPDTSPLISATLSALEAANCPKPVLSTVGGTSDGRFLAPYGTQVVELGPVNKTIHKVNESVSVKELETLTQIYQVIIEKIMA